MTSPTDFCTCYIQPKLHIAGKTSTLRLSWPNELSIKRYEIIKGAASTGPMPRSITSFNGRGPRVFCGVTGIVYSGGLQLFELIDAPFEDDIALGAEISKFYRRGGEAKGDQRISRFRFGFRGVIHA